MEIIFEKSKVKNFIGKRVEENLSIKVLNGEVLDVVSFSNLLEVDGDFKGNIKIERGRDLILNSDFKIEGDNYLILNSTEINLIVVTLKEDLEVLTRVGSLSVNVHENIYNKKINVNSKGDINLKVNREGINLNFLEGENIKVSGPISTINLEGRKGVNMGLLNQSSDLKIIGANKETFNEISAEREIIEEILEYVGEDSKIKFNILYNAKVVDGVCEIVVPKKYVDKKENIEIFLVYGEKVYKFKNKSSMKK